MKRVKWTAVFLAAMMVFSLSSGLLAEEPTDAPQDTEDAPIAAPVLPTYKAITGKVTEVLELVDQDGEVMEGKLRVTLSYDEENVVVFNLDEETLLLTETALSEIKEGDTFTGYYDQTLPVILIYPPQYHAVVAAVNWDADDTLAVSVFDDELVSEDGALALELAEDAELTLKNGEAYEGELKGCHLAIVFSGADAEGDAPAKALVKKAVVLKTPEPEEGLTEETIAFLKENVPNAEFVVQNEVIEAPAPYVTDEGVIMVPLRSIAEALEFEVTWNSELWCVEIGFTSSVFIGRDYYTYLKTAPIELGTAAVISSEGHTYVPMDYFTKVLKMGSAFYFEGQIVVDQENLMGEGN